jgi:hypothetical protein
VGRGTIGSIPGIHDCCKGKLREVELTAVQELQLQRAVERANFGPKLGDLCRRRGRRLRSEARVEATEETHVQALVHAEGIQTQPTVGPTSTVKQVDRRQHLQTTSERERHRSTRGRRAVVRA